MGSGASASDHRGAVQQGLRGIYAKSVEAAEDAQAVDITDQEGRKIGSAAASSRSSWLPASGKGQRHVEALKWSLSVSQWIRFVRECEKTATWAELKRAKGEYGLTMYDVNAHFVVPWTKGTGCSVALLLNPEPKAIEAMISHAWAGSVVETYNCLQNMVNYFNMSLEVRLFFCTFCMYQAEDEAPDGLTIAEQLDLKPFAQIIEARPLHGIFVVHTTVSEVYKRMWTVHEADEGITAGIEMCGLFDVFRWTCKLFDDAAQIRTSQGQCRPDDKAMLTALIENRGGFERLDESIAAFRLKMKQDLEALLVVRAPVIFENVHSKDIITQTRKDWLRFYHLWEDYDTRCETEIIDWIFAEMHYRGTFNTDIEEGRAKLRGERGRHLWPSDLLPLGADSYPFGPPRYFDSEESI